MLKGYKRYYFFILVLVVLYFVAQYYKPKETDWRLTLAAKDKIPYGTFIVYDQLKSLFPGAVIKKTTQPVYNIVNNSKDKHTAYILVERQLPLTETDENELLNYVLDGNDVFIAAFDISEHLRDTLKFKTEDFSHFLQADSVSLNFVNPLMKQDTNYRFYRNRIDGIFSKFDTLSTIVLGTNQYKEVNFIKIRFGGGAFYIHAAPLCFSNYFMLHQNNAEYTAKALSYIDPAVTHIYWDEYYKTGTATSDTPLRFLLNNEFLSWAYYITLFTMILFVLFEMKRRQRPIPVVEPLKNTSLEFVQTVGNVYFNKKDNLNIAHKKISYLKEFIRTRFYLSSAQWNDEFAELLTKKTGISEKEIRELVKKVVSVQNSTYVIDEELINLNRLIENFYTKAR